MRVEIAGYAWLDRSALTDRQVSNIVTRLTIQPKQTSDIAQAETPAPIHLYRLDEARNLLGVPRGFYRHMGTGVHEEVLRVGWGQPMRKLATTARFDGPFAEQTEAIDALVNALRPPETCPENPPWGGALLQAQPAFGKTCVSLEVARRLGCRTLVLVHQEFFLDQWRKRIGQFLPDARIGIIQQDRVEYARTKSGEAPDFVIGLLQSLARDTGGRYPREMYEDAFGLIISDECFVAGTAIQTERGLRNIEDIHVGDVVLNAVGQGCVKSAGSRLVAMSELRVVRMSDGTEVVCTSDHPFLTDDRWVHAADLVGLSVLTSSECIGTMRRYEASKNSTVSNVRKAGLREEGEEILLASMRGSCETQDSGDVRVLRIDGDKAEADEVLFSVLSAEMDVRTFRSFYAESFRCCTEVAFGEPACAEGSISSDEGIESDDINGYTRKSVSGSATDWSSTASKRWERDRDDGAAEENARSTDGRMGTRSGNPNDGQALEPGRISCCLQGGFGAQGDEDCSRDRRQVAWPTQSSGAGCEEGSVLTRIRVESVKIPEREDLERLGVCVEGDRVRVYNLSVSGHPSYVLGNGCVVHNCHRIGAASWGDIIPKFNAAYRLGLTATPRRKDGAEDVFFSHISPVTYRATTESVRPKLRKIVTTTELRAISRGEYKVPVDQLNSAQIINQVCLDTFRTQAIVDDLIQGVQAQRKIMVVSARLDHLREMADRTGQALFNLDLPFVPIIDFYTGQWFSHDVWDTTTKAHRKGDPKMVTREQADLDRAERANLIFATQQMVLEGLDIPALDVLLLATPISDVEQAAGRVRRWCLPEPRKCEHYCPWRAGRCKGKPIPIIVDVMDLRIPRLRGMAARRERFYKTCCTM